MYNFPKIQFGKKDFYVVDKFSYDGVTYLYIYEDVYKEGMEVENFDGEVEVNFIYKVDKDEKVYENVTDEALFNKLLSYASKRIVLKQNPYFNEN